MVKILNRKRKAPKKKVATKKVAPKKKAAPKKKVAAKSLAQKGVKKRILTAEGQTRRGIICR